MVNRFRGRGPYVAVSLPVSGYIAIRDGDGKQVLKPDGLFSGPPLTLGELEYIAHLLNVHDLLNGAK